uniref:Ig-like domain-containing protein n=1 Tax=Castor canadensis TaxID=51338 RepID=A0A8C0WMH0_CASCN
MSPSVVLSQRSIHATSRSLRFGLLRRNLILQALTHFLQYLKSECHFSHRMEWVQFLERHIYNREENLLFDSDLGHYRAVTELGQPDAKYWNSQKDFLELMWVEVDTYCRYNYGVGESFTVQKRVFPLICISSSFSEILSSDHNLLVCSMSGFYPGHIEIRWFWNGHEEEAGVLSTGLLQNGDWTFQTLVMLETVPQSGEVYTCQVEHPILKSPAAVEWSEGASRSGFGSKVARFRETGLEKRIRRASSKSPW